jgi:hypothetical protein
VPNALLFRGGQKTWLRKPNGTLYFLRITKWNTYNGEYTGKKWYGVHDTHVMWASASLESSSLDYCGRAQEAQTPSVVQLNN